MMSAADSMVNTRTDIFCWLFSSFLMLIWLVCECVSYFKAQNLSHFYLIKTHTHIRAHMYFLSPFLSSSVRLSIVHSRSMLDTSSSILLEFWTLCRDIRILSLREVVELREHAARLFVQLQYHVLVLVKNTHVHFYQNLKLIWNQLNSIKFAGSCKFFGFYLCVIVCILHLVHDFLEVHCAKVVENLHYDDKLSVAFKLCIC